MRKGFSISNDKVIINFTAKYCSTFEELVESEGFIRVLQTYLKKSKRKVTLSWRYLKTELKTDDINEIADIFIYLSNSDSVSINDNSMNIPIYLAERLRFSCTDNYASELDDILKKFSNFEIKS